MIYLKTKTLFEKKSKFEMICSRLLEKLKKIWLSVDEYIFLYQQQKLGLYDQKAIL